MTGGRGVNKIYLKEEGRRGEREGGGVGEKEKENEKEEGRV